MKKQKHLLLHSFAKPIKTHYYVSDNNLNSFLAILADKNQSENRLLWFTDMVIQNNQVIKSRFTAPTSKRLSDLNISLLTKDFQGVVISV